MLPDALNQHLIHLGYRSVKMLAQIVQDHAVIAPLAEHLMGQAQKQLVLVKQVHQYGLGAQLHQTRCGYILASVVPNHIISFPHIILAD